MRLSSPWPVIAKARGGRSTPPCRERARGLSHSSKCCRCCAPTRKRRRFTSASSPRMPPSVTPRPSRCRSRRWCRSAIARGRARLRRRRAKTAKKPVKVAEAPRRAVQEAPKPSTYMASVRPSLDPSRYASVRRPKSQPTDTRKAEPGDSDPEPRPAGRLDDIAKLLSVADSNDAGGEPMTEVAEALPPEPEPALVEPAVSRPKVEASRPKTAVSKPKVETARKAADDKKKADSAGRREEGEGGSRQAWRFRHQLGATGRRLQSGPHEHRI